MSNDNTEQIEFWNSDHGLAWARYADTVDVMFSDITDSVLDAAEVGVGDRVLDLGCGNGGTTLAAAKRVTAVGSVTAVDVSGPMIDRAQERADTANLVNVTFVLGDAAVYPFADGSFDKLISRLGAMFFDDPAAAFARLGPALAPGGRVALGVWREPRENLWAMEPVAAAKPFIEMPPRPGPGRPGAVLFRRSGSRASRAGRLRLAGYRSLATGFPDSPRPHHGRRTGLRHGDGAFVRAAGHGDGRQPDKGN